MMFWWFFKACKLNLEINYNTQDHTHTDRHTHTHTETHTQSGIVKWHVMRLTRIGLKAGN